MIQHWLSEPSKRAAKVAKAPDNYWNVTSKRGIKRIKKFARLKKKGIKYRAYMKSEDWRKRRAAYFAKFGCLCFACGSKEQITVHHLNYFNLSNELDEDLVALCWSCHEELHEQVGRGGKIANTSKATITFIVEKRAAAEFYELAKNL